MGTLGNTVKVTAASPYWAGRPPRRAAASRKRSGAGPEDLIMGWGGGAGAAGADEVIEYQNGVFGGHGGIAVKIGHLAGGEGEAAGAVEVGEDGGAGGGVVPGAGLPALGLEVRESGQLFTGDLDSEFVGVF